MEVLLDANSIVRAHGLLPLPTAGPDPAALDPALYPYLYVEVTNLTTGVTVATLDSAGKGGARLRESGSHYMANWAARNAQAGEQYRITAGVKGTDRNGTAVPPVVLGAVTLTTGVPTGDVTLVEGNQSVPIKF